MSQVELENLREVWKVRVDNFKKSGQSMSGWCKENDLKVHQLRYWLEKYDLQQQANSVGSKWVSVEVKDKDVYKDRVISVRIDQAIIELKPGFDPELLRDVIVALNVKC